MANEENEISVKLKWSFNEAKIFFVNKGIPLKESFVLKDIYLVKDNIDIYSSPNSKILSSCLIIRESICEQIDKELIYKERIFDDKENTIKRFKYSCPIVDINKTFELLNKIGYKECFRYEQECYCYEKKGNEILLQYIPELGLFAEIEKENASIEQLIEILNDFKIPYYENDYFVKKASLMLDRIKKQRR